MAYLSKTVAAAFFYNYILIIVMIQLYMWCYSGHSVLCELHTLERVLYHIQETLIAVKAKGVCVQS